MTSSCKRVRYSERRGKARICAPGLKCVGVDYFSLCRSSLARSPENAFKWQWWASGCSSSTNAVLVFECGDDREVGRAPACLPSLLPFGGMNIWRPRPALSGTCSTPIYIVEFDQPFRKTGSDDTQSCFRTCQATEDDWWWLQTHRHTCLSPEDNVHFDACKHVIATNELRKWLNYDRLASSPGLKINGCDAIRSCDRDNNNGERADHDDTQLFAVGAEDMLTYKMTSAGHRSKSTYNFCCATTHNVG